MNIIPAIDVRNGQVVRLQQGDYARQTTYAADPLQLAQHYAQCGATWLHLVDLDAARDGGFSLSQLVQNIKTSTTLRVQAGGGVRTRQHIKNLLEVGVDRVVIGTLAITEPGIVRECLQAFGSEAITLAFDVHANADGQWQCASHGWTAQTGPLLDDAILTFLDLGLTHILCTDIARDGLLGGYNTALYTHFQKRWPNLKVQASGGVNSIADLQHVRILDVDGAILGRALLEGKFSLEEALAC